MNCLSVQNQILMLADPRELSPALRAHVIGCAACQTWARQAARLEGILEHLPAPPAPGEKKEIMLGELMQAEPVIQPMVVPATRPSFGLVAVRFLRRNATYVGGLAATVLVAVGIYWLASSRSPVQPEMVRTPNDPLLQKMVAANTALARADTPARKLEVLNGMADALATDTRGMARLATGTELKQMAGRYEKVVKDGMVPVAKELWSRNETPVADRVKVLEGTAAKLKADATEADKLAAEAPQDAQPALKWMADTAREGEKTLLAQASGRK